MAIDVIVPDGRTQKMIWFPRLALPLMIGVILFLPRNLRFPYDRLSTLIIQMMALNNPSYWIHMFLLTLIHLSSLSILAVAAWTPWFPRLRSTAVKYSLSLCILLLLNIFMFRLITNAVYAVLPDPFPMEATSVLVWLERSFLEWLPQHVRWSSLSYVCSLSYGSIWLGSLTMLYPVLIYRDGGDILNDLVKFLILAPVLALPVYYVIPILDPWILNERYGLFQTFRYCDYPALTDTGRAFLAHIAMTGPESTAPSLPSFHIVYPLGIAMFLRRRGFPWLSAYFGLLMIWTAFVIVYLGRHFVMDIVGSIPFTFLIVALCDRVKVSFFHPHDPHCPPFRFLSCRKKN
jgi:hypothetical protein